MSLQADKDLVEGALVNEAESTQSRKKISHAEAGSDCNSARVLGTIMTRT